MTAFVLDWNNSRKIINFTEKQISHKKKIIHGNSLLLRELISLASQAGTIVEQSIFLVLFLFALVLISVNQIYQNPIQKLPGNSELFIQANHILLKNLILNMKYLCQDSQTKQLFRKSDRKQGNVKFTSASIADDDKLKAWIINSLLVWQSLQNKFERHEKKYIYIDNLIWPKAKRKRSISWTPKP